MTRKIAIQQPALPAYRVPFFKHLHELAGGHTVDVFYGSEEPALTNVDPVGFRGFFAPFRQWRLPLLGSVRWHGIQVKLVLSRDYDLVVLSSNPRVLSLWLALVMARVFSVNTAVWGHASTKCSRKAMRERINLAVMKLAGAVVLYDDLTYQHFLDAGFPAAKLYVAPNGLDSDALAEAREQALQTCGNKGGARTLLDVDASHVLLYVGRLEQTNRLDLAIQALPAVLDTFPNTRFIIIGKGDDEQRSLEKLATRLGVLSKVAFKGPIYNPVAVARWMLAADLFVYPSNIGLSLIHAFNNRLPVVVCPPVSAHNPEIATLVHRKNGIITDEMSAQSLAQSIAMLLTDSHTRNAMGTAGLAIVEQRYNNTEMVKAFLDLFRATAA